MGASPAQAETPSEGGAPQRMRMGNPSAPVSAGAPTRMGGGTTSASAGGPTRMGGGNTSGSAPTRMGSAGAPASAGAPSRMGNTSAPAQSVPGTAPRMQPTPTTIVVAPSRNPFRNIQWKRVLPAAVGLLVVAAAIVFLARWMRTLPEIQGFLLDFPGNPTLPDTAPTGLPAWMGWQHFLNLFFLVLIVRTGLQVRNEKKAPAHFTAKANSFFSPKGSTPKKVSLSQWLHQSLDVLWVANGIIFIVLLFASAQWMKIVPTSLDVFPNALSAALQYASLDWPHENGWLHYNALQMLAYFTTVFVAAPLAVISGMRFSTWWPDKNERLSKIYPIEIARAVHFPVMLYFVGFTLVHVFLVFFTGALRNLNHMYASRDVVDWIGLLIFLASLLVIAAAWFLTKPLFMRPVAGKLGTLSK